MNGITRYLCQAGTAKAKVASALELVSTSSTIIGMMSMQASNKFDEIDAEHHSLVL